MFMSLKIKKIILSAAVFVAVLPVYSYDNFDSVSNIGNYNNYKIQKGVFIKGILLKEVSSEINDLDDKVFLQNPFDIFIEDSIIIPKNSLLVGHISKIDKANTQQDGSLEIAIYKIVFPDRSAHLISAHVWSRNSKGIIGGGLTKRRGSRKVVHRSEGLGLGAIQMLPDGPRVFGKETKLQAGSEIIIQMDQDFELKNNL
jgi:hypothetical protein